MTGIIALLCDVLHTLANGHLADNLWRHTLRGSIAISLRVYVLLRPGRTSFFALLGKLLALELELIVRARYLHVVGHTFH